MRKKIILLIAITAGFQYSCSTMYYSHWDCTTYDPSQHTFEIDSVDLKKYGKEEIERSIRKGLADSWIVDSTTYFNFYIEQEKSTLPIIPIFYRVDFQKKKALYDFQLSVQNNKIYKSLDSVNYTIYDSLRTRNYEGGHKFNLDISESRQYELFKTPYLIDIQLKDSDVIYGDIELFFRDYYDKQVIQSIRKIKFKYKEGKYFTSDINS